MFLKVIKALKEAHEPDNIVTLLDRDSDVKKIKMKENNKPDVLFKAISKIENKYRKTAIKKWVDKDKMEIVMAKAHKSYKPMVTNFCLS